MRVRHWLALVVGMWWGIAAVAHGAETILPADQVRALAKEAYIYGFPMVDSYRIVYSYAVDKQNPEYKGPFNQIANMARVFTPEDKAVQTPNSDTPYSFVSLDLRTEPQVLTVPPVDPKRYFSIQLIDAYTYNFAYIGSRTTGNGGGKFLVAGPDWKGEAPPGIQQVFRCETRLCLALYRTQLFEPSDLPNVQAVQAGYKVEPLSAFLGRSGPPAAPALDFIKPLTPDEQKTSLEFFNVLNFVLASCPTLAEETELMARFAWLGIGPGKRLDIAALPPPTREAMAAGMADAWLQMQKFFANEVATGKVASGDLFGSRPYLKGNYLYRFAAAVLGIYGNSKEEAMYPAYRADGQGQALNGATQRYTLRFAPDQLPPVHAFWSLTMYELPSSLLTPNPLQRYLINSPMLPSLKRDPDGGLTLYIQKDSPGPDLESNWLPAPNGPFWCALRLYWPKAEALDGTWRNPPMLPVPAAQAASPS